MGLIRGSASITRFFVSGTFSKNDLDEYSKRISRFAFVNLDEYSDIERSTGWVNIMDMFDTDFDGRPFFMHPYVTLSFRVDVRKVPTNALKQHCRGAENKIKEAENLEYLPKAKRKELRDFMWFGCLNQHPRGLSQFKRAAKQCPCPISGYIRC